MNSKVYNVVILDKSGSMNSIRKAAVDSVNETFGAIRSARRSNEGQEHFVTLLAFCGCEQKMIYENTPIDEVTDISIDAYVPCCTTPLYDAIGITCSRLQTAVKGDPAASVAVTIITDGYENSSREFTQASVKALIEACKQAGWMFAYVGADHDVEAVAFSLNIDNHMKFDKSQQGMRMMSRTMNCCSMRFFRAESEMMANKSLSDEEIMEKRREASRNFFKKEDEE
ncbi:MAG: VWA domain-containing protein [Bacteroidales bacterium]|nr:VWA domain-containing protein [Bacteroidales bacterium]